MKTVTWKTNVNSRSMITFPANVTSSVYFGDVCVCVMSDGSAAELFHLYIFYVATTIPTIPQTLDNTMPTMANTSGSSQ